MSVPKLAQFRTQLDLIKKTIRTSNNQISIRGVKKIASKHWESFKRNVATSSKEVLWIDFERKENVFWYKIGSVLKVKRSTTAYRLFERVRTMYYDYKLMSGTKMDRAVSPECNENISSKRNLKNECKKLERQPLKRLQLCRRRLEKVEIIFLRCIW